MKNGRHEEPGRTTWFLNDQLHREDGPAVEWTSGRKAWHLYGQRHREDGPAIEDINGIKEWFFHGNRHREDGPAVVHSQGQQEWWINGVELTEEEFSHWLQKKALNEKLHNELPPRYKNKKNKI